MQEVQGVQLLPLRCLSAPRHFWMKLGTCTSGAREVATASVRGTQRDAALMSITTRAAASPSTYYMYFRTAYGMPDSAFMLPMQPLQSLETLQHGPAMAATTGAWVVGNDVRDLQPVPTLGGQDQEWLPLYMCCVTKPCCEGSSSSPFYFSCMYISGSSVALVIPIHAGLCVLYICVCLFRRCFANCHFFTLVSRFFTQFQI
jgi:hypothetical protein